jgi:hypothetical protein
MTTPKQAILQESNLDIHIYINLGAFLIEPNQSVYTFHEDALSPEGIQPVADGSMGENPILWSRETEI